MSDAFDDHDDDDNYGADGGFFFFPPTPEQERTTARMNEIREAYQRFSEEHSDFNPVGQEAALFRNIFGAYPCYRDSAKYGAGPVRFGMEEDVSPILAEIKALHDAQSPDLRVVRVEDLDFSRIMKGYNPLTRVYLVSNDYKGPEAERPNGYPPVDIAGMTIMHVVESVHMGAPDNEAYVYMWPGGLEYYNDPAKNEELMSVVSKPRVITFEDPYVWPARDDEQAPNDQNNGNPMGMIG